MDLPEFFSSPLAQSWLKQHGRGIYMYSKREGSRYLDLEGVQRSWSAPPPAGLKLSFGERMALVIAIKAEAIELFKEGLIAAAGNQFHMGLKQSWDPAMSGMPDAVWVAKAGDQRVGMDQFTPTPDDIFSLSNEQQALVRTLKATLHNNSAMCFIKLQYWSLARTSCDAVLAIEPENIKAPLPVTLAMGV
jgi:hypothetical protein